jgi:hypothetical protein
MRRAPRGGIVVDPTGHVEQHRGASLGLVDWPRRQAVELSSRFETLVGDSRFPRLMAAFIDAAERDPPLATLHVQLTERRREPVRLVLSQARQRGEIPPTTDLELAIDLLAGPAFYRRFIAHQPFPSGYAAAVVDHVLTAVLGMPSTD